MSYDELLEELNAAMLEGIKSRHAMDKADYDATVLSSNLLITGSGEGGFINGKNAELREAQRIVMLATDEAMMAARKLYLLAQERHDLAKARLHLVETKVNLALASKLE